MLLLDAMHITLALSPQETYAQYTNWRIKSQTRKLRKMRPVLALYSVVVTNIAPMTMYALKTKFWTATRYIHINQNALSARRRTKGTTRIAH